jgi:hypothetical protein
VRVANGGARLDSETNTQMFPTYECSIRFSRKQGRLPVQSESIPTEK